MLADHLVEPGGQLGDHGVEMRQLDRVGELGLVDQIVGQAKRDVAA